MGQGKCWLNAEVRDFTVIQWAIEGVCGRSEETFRGEEENDQTWSSVEVICIEWVRKRP